MRRKPQALALAAGGLLTGALLLEICLRLASGRPFDVESQPERRVRLAENNCAADYDPELGWSPTPAKSGRRNAWGTSVTITPDGLRSNGPASRASGPPLLAVGESFTFGDEVSDDQTWPARLESLTPYRALNAGVCAYGVDQAFLRLLKLAPLYKPKAVVFELIDLSLTRAMVKAYPTPAGVKAKPWIRVQKGGFVVEGRPVPSAPAPAVPAWKRAAGRSFLFDAVLSRLAPGTWDIRAPAAPPAFTGQDGAQIGCAVVSSLPEVLKGTRAVVLLEHHAWESADGKRAMDSMKRCAERAGLRVADVRDIPTARPGGHPSSDGNLKVAQAVAAALR